VLQQNLSLLPGPSPAAGSAEAAAGEILSLPVYPGIRVDQVERVAEALLRAVRP
jgi:dTDP-4-amino-4,6-dideoxygalactose transaminase